MNASNASTPTSNRSTTVRPNDGHATQPALALVTPPLVTSAGECPALMSVPDTAPGLLACLHELGYASAALQDARTLLDRHGEDTLRDVVRGAKRGEAGRLARLGELMLQQRIAPAARVPLILTQEPPPPLGEPVQFVPVEPTPASSSSLSGRQLSGHVCPAAAATNRPISLQPVIRDQVKVFGAKAALTLVADTTRAGTATVTIEAAAALGGNERRYDWTNKLRFQLTGPELQLVTALLMGQLKTISFRNHGDKWLRMIHQEPGSGYAGIIQVALGQGSGTEAITRTVAIDPNVLGETISLFMRQTASCMKLPTEMLAPILGIVSAAHKAREARDSR